MSVRPSVLSAWVFHLWAIPRCRSEWIAFAGARLEKAGDERMSGGKGVTMAAAEIFL